MSVESIIRDCEITDFTIVGRRILIRNMRKPSYSLEKLPYELVFDGSLSILPKNLVKADFIGATYKGSKVLGVLNCNKIGLSGSSSTVLEAIELNSSELDFDTVKVNNTKIKAAKHSQLISCSFINSSISSDKVSLYAGARKGLNYIKTNIRSKNIKVTGNIVFNWCNFSADTIDLEKASESSGDISITETDILRTPCFSKLEFSLSGLKNLYLLSPPTDYLTLSDRVLTKFRGKVETIYLSDKLDYLIESITQDLDYRNIELVSGTGL